jgi:dTMP kinase
MTLLVAIEGADGAGKATAAANACMMLVERGISACVISFPRYSETTGGFALGEFLSGRIPVPVTPRAAAVLYGLDRLESVDTVAEAAASHEVVIFDRYIASNMVYQASKVPPAAAREMMDWVFRMETETFGVQPPDLSIYLDTPLETAHQLMLLKHRRSYTDRQYDEHEADLELQLRVRENYARIAQDGLAGAWQVVNTMAQSSIRPPLDIAHEIVEHVLTSGAGQESRRLIASKA